ncbi:hypothetical protein ABIF73_000845 [Bradyrhizobium japonicum]|uniref:hypothetical protein n=1 Tax=Bradyrhizobium japonicum TaxID=375 RepID=UPI003399F5EC
MNERLTRLRQRFAAAKSDADVANRDVRIESARRLAQLQRAGDPKKLVTGLKDPALTAQDREQLIHFVASQIPGARPRLTASGAMAIEWSFRHVRYHWRGLLVGGLMFMVLAMMLATILRNTPVGKARFDQNVTLQFATANGVTGTVTYYSGEDAIVLSRPTSSTVRLQIWSKDLGYATSDVDATWFVAHAYAAVPARGR